MSASDHIEDIGSGRKGKKGELIVLGELLIRGYNVFTPLVDSGIDCVVDIGQGKYKEIQVKYREGDANFRVRDFGERPNYFIICLYRNDVTQRNDTWVIPSKEFNKIAKKTKDGYLLRSLGKEGSEAHQKLARFREDYSQLIQGATEEVKEQVEKTSKANRIAGDHLTPTDLMMTILGVFAAKPEKEFSTAEILEILESIERPVFSKTDLEELPSGGPRWKENARFALYQVLRKKGLVELVGRSKWKATQKAKDDFKNWPTKGSEYDPLKAVADTFERLNRELKLSES